MGFGRPNFPRSPSKIPALARMCWVKKVSSPIWQTCHWSDVSLGIICSPCLLTLPPFYIPSLGNANRFFLSHSKVDSCAGKRAAQMWLISHIFFNLFGFSAPRSVVKAKGNNKILLWVSYQWSPGMQFKLCKASGGSLSQKTLCSLWDRYHQRVEFIS